MTGRYPIPDEGFDRRFSIGLLADVAGLLEQHGYPRPEGPGDLIHWQQALFRAIYSTQTKERVLI